MAIGRSPTGFLLFYSRDCSSSHKITEVKAAIRALVHDVPQQNFAESNGLDDC
jgi:hypothetical protein